MTAFTETATFDASVPQILTSDKVLGGPTGAINVTLQTLVDRTAYLKQQVDAFVSLTIPDATTSIKGKVQLATTVEAAAGTDTGKAVTAAGVAAAISAAGVPSYGAIGSIIFARYDNGYGNVSSRVISPGGSVSGAHLIAAGFDGNGALKTYGSSFSGTWQVCGDIEYWNSVGLDPSQYGVTAFKRTA